MGRSPRRHIVGSLAAAFVVFGLLAPVAASAQAPLETARERYAAGDFPGTLETLDAASQGDGLTSEQLVELLELRALASFGLGQREAIETAAAQLAAVAPGRELDRTLPPPVRDAFSQQVRRRTGQLGIEATAVRGVGEVTIRATATNEPVGLVRQLRVAARLAGEDWQRADNGLLNVSARAGGTIEYYAELVSFGGAVVATHGSSEQPLTVEVSDPSAGSGRVGPGGEDGGGLSAGAVIGIIAGVAVAVAGGVLLALYLTRTTNTQLSAPEAGVGPP